jgi:acetoin utilization protein AcuB
MALVVFDRGTRIKTPASSIFPPRRVEASSASAAEAAIPSGQNSPRAEYEQEVADFAQLADSVEHKAAATAYAANAHTHPPEKKPLLARQIMSSPVISCQTDTSVAGALKQMETAGVHYLAVFDRDNELTGLINRRELLLNPRLAGALVEEAIQQHFLAATPETPVLQIAANFLEYQCGAVLVLDSEDQLSGIITRTDLIRLLISQAQVEGWV